MANHTIYPLSPDHIPALVQMEYELFPENNFNEQTLLKQISEGTGWIIFVDDHPAGYTFGKLDGDLVDILRLGVLPNYREHGLGTVLLRSMLRARKEAMLIVKKSNIPAINLYLKHGFEIVGTLPQYNCWAMKTTFS